MRCKETITIVQIISQLTFGKNTYTWPFTRNLSLDHTVALHPSHVYSGYDNHNAGRKLQALWCSNIPFMEMTVVSLN